MGNYIEETIEKLKTQARESWRGKTGEERAIRLEAFLREKLKEYSEALGLDQEHIFRSLESNRNYCAINYYQEANFPNLDKVRVYRTEEELRSSIKKLEFRCPSCRGVSTDPYQCNASDSCDWKSYGLFGTAGNGLRFTIKDTFLDKPFVDEIFMPVEFEREAAA